MKLKNLHLIIQPTIISLLVFGAVIFTSPATTKATEPFSSSNVAKNNFLVISDIHLDIKSKRSMTINPLGFNSSNDLDKKTFLKMLTAINSNIKKHILAKPHFILLLGDFAGHTRLSPKDGYVNELQTLNLLKNNFPHTPLLYVFGNSDSLDDDYGNFTSSNKKHDSPYSIARKSGWKNGFLSTGNICSPNDDNHFFPCIITENRKLGYYSSYLYPNLRLIVLNSILFVAKRTDNQAEEYSQTELQWLTEQLADAQNKNESVLIAMHIPPGSNILDNSDFWRKTCNKAFLSAVKTYQDNIIGILAAHTHMEELKIIQEKIAEDKENNQTKQDVKNQNISLISMTAGLSTSHGNSPSVKTFYLTQKDQQWQLFDYTTFKLDEDGNHTIFIKKLYNYRDKYCPQNQEQENSMLECLSRDNLNDITANIVKYYTVKNPHFPGLILAPGNVFVRS